MQQNGMIFYNLSLYTGNITVTASTRELRHTFSDLIKFYPYNISVTPVNSAGSGPTRWLQLKTDEDGKLIYIQNPVKHLRWNFFTPQEMYFSIKDFFSKCDQICSKLIFCAVFVRIASGFQLLFIFADSSIVDV